MFHFLYVWWVKSSWRDIVALAADIIRCPSVVNLHACKDESAMFWTLFICEAIKINLDDSFL